MAMKFLTNIDLNKNEIQNVALQNVAADPAVVSSVQGQVIFNTTDKMFKYFNGTAWVPISDGVVKKVDVASGETVVAVDNTDVKNPLLSFKKSATQGTGVTVSKETDGLKVVVQDGTTAQKGIVQLSSTPSATEEATAATPKGANVTVAKDATAASGDAYSYTLAQGGTDITTKIEMPQATTAIVGMAMLSDASSATENAKAATPKGAHVTVTKETTATTGSAYTYTLAQGGTNVDTKVEMAKGTTSVTGMVQLSSAVSDSDETTAATPKGANVQVAKETTATSGSAYTYKLTQGGSDVTTKIEMIQGTTSAVGMVQLTSSPSSTDEAMAITPKGANVTIEEQATPETGYLKTYVVKQGGTALATKINIPKDFLVKSGRVVTATDYAVGVAYKKGDIINNTSKSYVVKADIAASANTKFSDVSTKELDSVAAAGDKIIVFVVNVKEGSADDEFIVLPAKDLVDIYTGDKGIVIDASNKISVINGDGLAIDNTSKAVYVDTGDGLAIDATSKKVKVDTGSGIAISSSKVVVDVDNSSLEVNASNKVKIKNDITAQATQAVYPVTLTANGLVASYGSAVKTAKKTSGTIASGATTATVSLSDGQELLDYYVLDASGNKVITDVTVATSGVTFTVSATTETLTCYVVYQDTALQA